MFVYVVVFFSYESTSSVAGTGFILLQDLGRDLSLLDVRSSLVSNSFSSIPFSSGSPAGTILYMSEVAPKTIVVSAVVIFLLTISFIIMFP